MKAEVSDEIQNIFNALARNEADRLLKLVVIKYEKTAPSKHSDSRGRLTLDQTKSLGKTSLVSLKLRQTYVFKGA